MTTYENDSDWINDAKAQIKKWLKEDDTVYWVDGGLAHGLIAPRDAAHFGADEDEICRIYISQDAAEQAAQECKKRMAGNDVIKWCVSDSSAWLYRFPPFATTLVLEDGKAIALNRSSGPEDVLNEDIFKFGRKTPDRVQKKSPSPH